MNHSNKVLCFITLAVIVTEGLALNCFMCSGPTDGGCANANPTDLIKQPCNKRKFLNKPIAQYTELENAIDITAACFQVKGGMNNVTQVDRGCIFVPANDYSDMCKIFGNIMDVEVCSFCTSNYCNAKQFKLKY